MAQGNSDKINDVGENMYARGSIGDEEDDRRPETISRDLGIALGLTNAYLKRCERKDS